jgi:hypothetical protein
VRQERQRPRWPCWRGSYLCSQNLKKGAKIGSHRQPLQFQRKGPALWHILQAYLWLNLECLSTFAAVVLNRQERQRRFGFERFTVRGRQRGRALIVDICSI